MHGFCQKIELFITGVFWAKQAREDRVLIFSKGLVHGFCQKIELSVIYVFLANQARKNRFLVNWIKKNAF